MTQQNGEPPLGGETERRYELAGDGLQITYRQVTIPDNGTSQSLSYRDPDGNNRTFGGNEIHSQTSELGTLLTVTLQIILATNEETKLTLLLPGVHPPLANVPIKTLAILTRSIYPTIGPPIEGQLPTYQVYNLQGTAKTIFYP
jgi:hypothetical protein